MHSNDARDAFYERRWFKGTVAVLGLIGAVVALIGPPKLWDVISDLFRNDLPPSDTEYILDASAAMGEPFGTVEGATKLSAAAEAIAQSILPLENEGLALRRLGGTCDETGDLLVDFGAGRNDEVSDAAADQEAAGESNLAQAVIAAIDDFHGDRFPTDRTFTKRIVVVTGTVDNCSGDNAAELIRRRLENAGVELDFTYVGLGIPEADRDRLREIAGDEDVLFADTEDELAQVVDFLELEPVISDSEAILEIHNDVIDRLNVFIGHLNAGRTDPAAAALEDANAAFSRGEPRFDSIVVHETRPDLQAMARLVAQARAIQEQLFDVGETLLGLRRDLGAEATSANYENALAEWNGTIQRQQENVDEINRANEELVAKLPPVET
jgi:hypothetical protein